MNLKPYTLLLALSLASVAGCSSVPEKKSAESTASPAVISENIQNDQSVTQNPTTPAASAQTESAKPVNVAQNAAVPVSASAPVAPATPPSPVATSGNPAASDIPAKQTDNAAAGNTALADTSADTQPNSQVDVWQRIRNGFAMADMNNKLVARFERWYADRPDYIERMTERSRRYLYFIVGEVEKRGMPTEIALLPMIESAFNPGANSIARASGIWQFIPSTGKNFGMQQNWWYDGRRDVISATKGALDYLQQLHDQFGSWELALAAYNAGENAVSRAISRNRKLKKPTNYESLRLPRETRQYVPKLMAIKNIISYPSSFGLVLADVPNKPYFSEVTTSQHIDVELAAEMAGISMEEFSALNPAHSRPVILQKQDEVLLLPVEAASRFQENLEKADKPLVSWQACPTKKGEKLEEISEKYSISLEKLRSVNGIHRSILVSNGQTLLVPLNGEEPQAEFTAFNTNLPPTDYGMLNAVRHIVRRGDTLSGIARKYHVRLASLKSWNHGVRILHPGQHIWVAQPQTQNASRANRNIRRTSVKVKRNVHPEKM